MTRLILSFLTVSLVPLIALAAPPRDMKKIKKEKEATERIISDTNKKLNAKNKETQRTLGRLSEINGEIARTSSEITAISHQVDSLNRKIKSASDTIDALTNRLEVMQKSYVKYLRDMQGSMEPLSFMGFVFSSHSFGQAMARMRYVSEFGRWHTRRQREIKDACDELTKRRADLGRVYSQRESSLTALNDNKKSLESQKSDADKLVVQLKKEQSSLRNVLKENERRMRKLDDELDRLIAEEQRRRENDAAGKGGKKQSDNKGKAPSKGSKSGGKADKPEPAPKTLVAEADRQMNGSFESNKGRLLFPVKGRYTIVKKFGRNKHPQLEHVETINNGIDIGVSDGTSARCIFDGVVSAIFRQEGFGNIVMVRHGSYLSIYANLSSISVHQGQKLTAGQDIGVVGQDESGRNVMHFELRRERNKLNPTEWVR